MKREDQESKDFRYMVIPRVLIFVFNENDQVLLIKGSSDKKLWSGKWNGLGGHVEAREDIISAAKRELFEESGLIRCRLTLCGIVMINTGANPGICMHVIKAGNCEGKLKNSTEGELKWIKLDELDKYSLVDDLPTLLSKIKEQEEGSLFYALYEFDVNNQLVIKFS